MKDLTKQLRHLIAVYGAPGVDVDQAVADIEKAYADAGYIKAEAIQTTYGPIKITPLTKQGAVTPQQFMATKKLMTGQEWYDRFVALAPVQLTKADELDFNLHEDDPEDNCYYAYNCAVADIKRAAKKAAGLVDHE